MIRALHEIWVWGGYAAVLSVVALALWRGGWAERSGAVTVLAAWLITPLLQHGYDPGLGSIVVDGLTAVILFIISERSRRIWTLLISASMFGAFACHFMAGHSKWFPYLTALGLLGGVYLVICLLIGVIENEYLKGRELLDRQPDA